MAELEGQTIWQRVEERARAEGIEQGRAEGVERGRTEGIELGRAEGIELGRIAGIQQGQVLLLRTLLEQRFVPPPLPGWVHERLEVATEQDILRWSGRLMADGTVTLEQIFLS